MRLRLLMALGVLLIQACGTQVTKEENAKMVEEGKELANTNDCKTCHHITNRIIGPAHTDVAKKYDFTDANVSLLAERIIKGGGGVWGEQPMNPHTDLSKEDAEKMARYVLSLDGEEYH